MHAVTPICFCVPPPPTPSQNLADMRAKTKLLDFTYNSELSCRAMQDADFEPTNPRPQNSQLKRTNTGLHKEVTDF